MNVSSSRAHNRWGMALGSNQEGLAQRQAPSLESSRFPAPKLPPLFHISAAHPRALRLILSVKSHHCLPDVAPQCYPEHVLNLPAKQQLNGGKADTKLGFQALELPSAPNPASLRAPRQGNLFWVLYVQFKQMTHVTCHIDAQSSHLLNICVWWHRLWSQPWIRSQCHHLGEWPWRSYWTSQCWFLHLKIQA